MACSRGDLERLCSIAIGVLAATDAPVVTMSIVVGGAAACIALSIAGEASTSARPGSGSQDPDPPTRPRPETH